MSHPLWDELDRLAYQVLDGDPSIDDHVTGCGACGQELARFRIEQEFLKSALQSLAATSPEDQSPARPVSSALLTGYRRSWRPLLSLLAAGFLIGVLVFVLVWRSASAPMPQDGMGNSSPAGRDKLRKAERCLAEGRYEDAVILFEAAGRLDPSIAETCRLRKAIAIDSLASARLGEARRLAGEGKFEEANGILRELITDYSETPSFQGAKDLTREIIEKLEKDNGKYRGRPIPIEKK